MLLEAFNLPVAAQVISMDGTPNDNKDFQQLNQAIPLPLTGFTPLQYDLEQEVGSSSENTLNREKNGGWYRASPSSSTSTDAEKKFQETHSMPAAEGMHMACKVLLILVKFRSEHIKVRRYHFNGEPASV